jgi:AcrR family transcriptional regulator
MQANKQKKILAAAADLISTEGYKGTSLQKIADKVGLHKSTLFHYIRSKKDLLVYILEQSTNIVYSNLIKISNSKESEPEEKLRAAFENHLSSIVEDISGFNIFLNELKILPPKYRKVYMQKRKNYEKYFKQIVAETKGKGYFKGLNSKIVTFGILGMLNSIPRWYKAGGPLTIKEVSDILFKMIVKK